LVLVDDIDTIAIGGIYTRAMPVRARRIDEKYASRHQLPCRASLEIITVSRAMQAKAGVVYTGY